MLTLKVKIFVLIMLSVIGGCATVEQNRNGDAGFEGKKILLVNTNSNIEKYKVAEVSYSSLFNDGEVESVNLSDESEPLELLLDQLNSNRYDAVYCVGGKSLGLIDYIDPEIPVVFNSVLNWRRFKPTAGYYGVASEVGLLAQLTWFKYLFPEVSTLGVLYSEANDSLVRDAVEQAEEMGVQLITSALESPRELETKSVEMLSKVDALWLISDPVVMSSEEKVERLFAVARRNSKPIFAYDRLYIDMGATLAIIADLATAGRQAALMTKAILSESYQGDAITFPAGSHLILNTKVLESSRLKLNEDALDSVSEIRD